MSNDNQRLVCEGAIIGRLYLPPFLLSLGGAIRLILPVNLRSEDINGLRDILSGETASPNIAIRGRAFDELEMLRSTRPALVNLVFPEKLGNHLRKKFRLDNSGVEDILTELGFRADDTVGSLNAAKRTLLAAAVSLRRSECVLLADFGFDDSGRRSFYNLVKTKINERAVVVLSTAQVTPLLSGLDLPFLENVVARSTE